MRRIICALILCVLCCLHATSIVGRPRLIAPEAKFGQWHNEVHVKIKGLDDYEFSREELEFYLEDRIDDLDLELDILFDDDITMGGIEYNFIRLGKRKQPFNTNQGTIFMQGEPLGPYNTIVPFAKNVITVDLDFLDLYDKSNKKNAFLNLSLHEFIHALVFTESDSMHLPQHKKIPNPLMSSELSTAWLEWTYNDKRLLLDKYGKRGKLYKFDKEDIGRDLILLNKKNKKMSVSSKITDEEMYIDWLWKGKHKRIVR